MRPSLATSRSPTKAPSPISIRKRTIGGWSAIVRAAPRALSGSLAPCFLHHHPGVIRGRLGVHLAHLRHRIPLGDKPSRENRGNFAHCARFQPVDLNAVDFAHVWRLGDADSHSSPPPANVVP